MFKKKSHSQLNNFIKAGLTVLISVLIIFTVVKASTVKITPPTGAPVATFYSLSEIYQFIASSTAATVGNPALDFSAALEDTGYTLTEIYNALAGLIVADKVFTGTTYLGTTGTLKLACATSTFDGTGNLVTDAYDGDGNGANRWCMATSTNSAAAPQILLNYKSWADGIELTGTWNAANLSTSTVKFGVTFATSSTGALYGDTNAAYVLGTASASGTALAYLFNGSLTAGGFPGGSQALGGVDDYNAGNAAGRPADSYSKGWTACNAGNSYCGTSDSGADAKDNSTGLIWSMPCNGAGCDSFSDASPMTYSWSAISTNNYSTAQAATSTASGLCTNGDHGQTGWSLPHQKQLMQAYIDGSWGNLEGVYRYYWSATTGSDSTTNAWNTTLSNGITDYLTAKTSASYVRCVR